MAILPKKLRFWLFDTLSLVTMRYVEAVPRRKATGLVAEVYDQIDRDFFVNGSLTSRSKVPELLAGIWAAGRETILVDDQLDRTTKEAIAATLSNVNDCPYCGDMLISLVHAGDRPDDAMQILAKNEENIQDPVLRDQLAWVQAFTTPGHATPEHMPFAPDQMPEVIGSIMAMSDINRFSHIVMDGSPVKAPWGMQRIKELALKIFGNELRATHSDPMLPGDTRQLLPEAKLPDDMYWARSNPRIACALAQLAAAVEHEGAKVIPDAVHVLVSDNLARWHGEQMPISRSWVDREVGHLTGLDRDIAVLALLLAKASYQIDDGIVQAVRGQVDEMDFIRILAWSSFTASRHVAGRIADGVGIRRQLSSVA